ncbi:UDP-N-acetylglucosamine-transferase [Micromonospora tulbaghiae]|uniref:UDP-N-acetylglucosamine-transferase n=1 Tax=Micromonospora TaxID=1873 RepID=UPI00207C83B7|nr:UDP-N-acetylglucosamine-transferase [Micromonospora sp. CPM1]MCO1613327.1 UDP-N-acetylglucosamine-transferase [Micromonospora sp. CPM1]
MTIFVAIASYRDRELVPTVLDCLAKAARPEDVRIAVCWQHLGDEDISAIRDLPQVDVQEYDARDSRGACWARDKTFQRYRGEDWLLQVDSHTRFAPDWDVRLIRMARETGAAKPVLTAYPASYEPDQEFTGAGAPAEIVVSDWTTFGVPVLGQRLIEGAGSGVPPKPALFLAAGFLFAPGSFVAEVPYDPGIYFNGEEITLALRAFTWGYDLFHPTEVLAWHYYIRQDRPRHWSDHVESDWARYEELSRRRVLYMLHTPPTDRLGIGPVRTLEQFVAHTGCNFTRRTWTDMLAQELVLL